MEVLVRLAENAGRIFLSILSILKKTVAISFAKKL